MMRQLFRAAPRLAPLTLALALAAALPSRAQEVSMQALPDGLLLARQGLSPDGRRVVAVERGGAACWTLRALSEASGAWRPAAELRAGSTGSTCLPEVTTASADGTAALVYTWQAGRADLVGVGRGQLTAGPRLEVTGELGYANAPPAGAALAPDGSRALLGVTNLDCKVGVPYPRCGGALLFAREAAGWREVHRFAFPEGGPFNIIFGQSLGLSRGGQVVAIGGPGHVGDQGEIYVFEQRGGGWAEVGVLVPDERNDAIFGTDLAITPDGRNIAVAAEHAVYMFARGARGWSQTARIASPGPAVGTFGAAVALSHDGRRLLVGAPRTACAELPRCGAAFLFERDGGVDSNWRLRTELAPPEPRPMIDFGWQLALDQLGTVAVVQADRAYVIRLP